MARPSRSAMEMGAPRRAIAAAAAGTGRSPAPRTSAAPRAAASAMILRGKKPKPEALRLERRRADLLASLALFDDDPARINQIEPGLMALTPEVVQRTASHRARDTEERPMPQER